MDRATRAALGRGHKDAARGPRSPLLAGIRPRLSRELREQHRFPRITNFVVRVRFSHPIYRRYVVLHIPHAEYVPNDLPAVKIRLTNGFSNTTCLIFHTGYMILTGARNFYTAYRDAYLCYFLLMDIPQPMLVRPGRAPALPPPPPGTAPLPAARQYPNAMPNASYLRGTRRPSTRSAIRNRDEVQDAPRLEARPLGARLRICSATVENMVSTGVLCGHSLALDAIDRAFPECTSYDPHAFAGLYFTIKSEDCPELATLLPAPGTPTIPSGDIMFGNRLVGGDTSNPHRSMKASIFDSGSCSIIGKSTEAANRCAYRYLAQKFDPFDDPTRPFSRKQIHAYRLARYMNPTPGTLQYDISRAQPQGGAVSAEEDAADDAIDPLLLQDLLSMHEHRTMM